MTLREVAFGLFGAYRLARFDALGMTFFDTSITGFWRSFFAAALVAPLYLTMLFSQIVAGDVIAALPRFFIVQAIGYVILWVAYPLLMIPVTDFLDRGNKYLGYIVAYNWSAVWQQLLFVPLTVLGRAGVLSPELGILLTIAAFIYVSAYIWFVALAALEIPGLVAFAILAGDLFLSFLIQLLVASMIT